MKSIALTSRDLLFGGINGLTFGLLLPVVLDSFNVQNMPPYALTVLSFVLLATVGIYVGYLLSKVKPFFFQLAKFGATGAANFAIDIGVLTLLLTVFYGNGLEIPFTYFVIFKIISFILSATNSYIWNKFWSFNTNKKATKKKMGQEFGKFVLVSVIGLVVNVLVASTVKSLDMLLPIAPTAWAAIAGMTGSIATLTWNFVGYKFIVFKK